MGISERKARVFRQREREILGAVAESVPAGDWRLLTVDEIARRAEIGKGTLYLHFASKEAVFARLAIQRYKRLLGKTRGGADRTARERLMGLAREALRLRTEEPEWLALIQHCQQPGLLASLDVDLSAEFRAVLTALADVLAELIGEARHPAPTPPSLLRPWVLGAWGVLLGAPPGGIGGLATPGNAGQDSGLLAASLSDFVLRGWGVPTPP